MIKYILKKRFNYADTTLFAVTTVIFREQGLVAGFIVLVVGAVIIDIWEQFAND